MNPMSRVQHEIKHGAMLAAVDTEKAWGWGTPAGRIRAGRRAELIAETAELKPGKRVLEVGCGTGLFTELFSQTGAEILAVDISTELISKAKERNLPGDRVVFREARFEDCDVDGPFDAVIGSSVLHHLEIDQALRKIYRLLKPGGFMSFAEPNARNPQVYAMFRFRFLFKYISPDEMPIRKGEICRKLLAAGFRDVAADPFDWLHPATPEWMISTISDIGNRLEKLPIVGEFAGSLLIRGRKPRAVVTLAPPASG